MKPRFVSAIIVSSALWAFWASSTGSSVFAGEPAACALPLCAVSSALTQVPGGLTRHEFYELAIIPEGDLAAARQAAKDFGVDGLQSKYYVDYVDAVFRKIKAENMAPVEAGEKMAQFGKKIDTLISKLLTKGERKSADFAIADAVAALEEFKPEEFKPAENLHWIDSGAPFVHTDDYLSYTEGYIDTKPPYSNHPWGGSVITLTDIRDGASHNFFPLQLNPHDMRHIHYGTGHPRPTAMYMKTARGHNHLRFALEGCMYEGVDQVQYSAERLLSKYMAESRHMDLEEAMVFIARATKEDMETIMDGAGIRSDMEGGAASHANWAPSTKGDIQATRNGKSLDQELDNFVDKGWGYLQLPELRKYTNFATNPTPGVGALRQKDVILNAERIQRINEGTLNAPEAEAGTEGAALPAPREDAAPPAPGQPPEAPPRPSLMDRVHNFFQ